MDENEPGWLKAMRWCAENKTSALVRQKGFTDLEVASVCWRGSLMYSGDHVLHIDPDKVWEMSTDNGKTWYPAGQKTRAVAVAGYEPRGQPVAYTLDTLVYHGAWFSDDGASGGGRLYRTQEEDGNRSPYIEYWKPSTEEWKRSMSFGRGPYTLASEQETAKVEPREDTHLRRSMVAEPLRLCSSVGVDASCEIMWHPTVADFVDSSGRRLGFSPGTPRVPSDGKPWGSP